MRCPACDSNDTTDAWLCAACMDMFFSNPQGSFQERAAEWQGTAVTLLSWVETPDTYPPMPPEWRSRVHPPSQPRPTSTPPEPTTTLTEAPTPAANRRPAHSDPVTSAPLAAAPARETTARPSVTLAQPKPKVDLTDVFNKIAAAEQASTAAPIGEDTPPAPVIPAEQPAQNPVSAMSDTAAGSTALNLEAVFKKLDAPVPPPPASKPVDETELAAFFHSLNALPPPTPAPAHKELPAAHLPIANEKVVPPVPAPTAPANLKRSLLDFVQDAYGENPPPPPLKKSAPTATPALEVTSDDEDEGNLLDGLAFTPDAPTDWLSGPDIAREEPSREIEI